MRAIASHGQTVWHEPGHSTWQFGEAAVIAERTGIDVVSDFRVRDMAAGGQGAPLVPIADALALLERTDVARAAEPRRHWQRDRRAPRRRTRGVRAFDTGPGVGVIDGVTRMLVPELPYDCRRRARAARPAVRARWCDELLAEPYFAAPPPKSTGPELFTRTTWRGSSRAVGASRKRQHEDIVATAVE